MKTTADLSPVFICGFGRPGMQFLHALFDGHPQVLIVPAILKFHLEWKRNGWANLDPQKLAHACAMQRHLRAELANEAVGALDVDDASPRAYSVDRERFMDRFQKLLTERGTSRRDVFLSLHDAYAFAAGLDISNRRVVVENAHTMEQAGDILRDFPTARLIVLVREPRAAFASCMRRYNHKPFSDPGRAYADLIASGFVLLKELRERLPARNLKIVRAEDLNAETPKVMRELASWCGIDFTAALVEPTRAGQRWLANSNNPNPAATGDFEAELWPTERMMIDWLTANSAGAFGYRVAETSPFAVVSLAAPSRFQLRAPRSAGAASGPYELLHRLSWRLVHQLGRIASLVLLLARFRWLADACAYHRGRLPVRRRALLPAPFAPEAKSRIINDASTCLT